MHPKTIIDNAIAYVPLGETKYITAYATRQKFLKVILLSALAGWLISRMLHIELGYYIALTVALISAAAYFLGKYLYRRRLMNILDKECDPQTFCDHIYSAMTHLRSQKYYFSMLFSFLRGLKYWGRFDKMHQVLTVARESVITAEDAFFFNCAMFDYAFETSDTSLSEAFIGPISQLDASIAHKRFIREMQTKRMYDYELLRMQAKGDIVSLYETYVGMDNNPLERKAQRVVRFYRMANIAGKLGLREDKQSRLEYVVNEGNKIWCVAEAMRQLGYIEEEQISA